MVSFEAFNKYSPMNLKCCLWYKTLGPSVEYTLHLTKILIVKIRSDHQKKIPTSAAPMSR